jgi:hypothetical protein
MTPSSMNEFSPDLLQAGDNIQLENWMTGKGSSIYVKWIPNEMTETIARNFFESLGTVSKIVIEKVGKDRRMFVYFSEWSPVQKSVVKDIAHAYPNYYYMYIHIPSESWYDWFYPIQCRINVNTMPVDLIEKHDEISAINTQLEGFTNLSNPFISTSEADITNENWYKREIAKMKIEVLRRDDMIDELMDANRNLGLELQELKEKCESASYVSCPYSGDPSEEESRFRINDPPNLYELSDEYFNDEIDWYESSDAIDNWNKQVLRKGLPDRHMK